MREEITLAREIFPKFPSRCVFCDQSTKNQIKINSEYKGEQETSKDKYKWALSERDKTQIPAHFECYRNKISKSKLLKFSYVLLAFACAITFFILEIYEIPTPFELNRTTMIITSIIVFTLLFLIDEFYFATFELSVSERKVTYRFKNKEYAEEFIHLNQTKKKSQKLYGEFDNELKSIRTNLNIMKLLDSKKYFEVVEASTHLIKSEPKNADGYEFRGEAFLRLKRFDEALQDLNKSLEFSEKNAYALWLRAITNRKLRRYEQSREDRQLMKAIELEEKLREKKDAF